MKKKMPNFFEKSKADKDKGMKEGAKADKMKDKLFQKKKK